MLEQVTTTTQYVFRPLADEERGELYTNEYVKKMARDEFSRYELIGGEI